MTLTDEIVGYIQSKGIRYRDSGDELNFESCPFCHIRGFDHFYLNRKTGVYWCHHAACQAKGSFYSFKAHMGDLMSVKTFSDISQEPEKPKVDYDSLMQEIETYHHNLQLELGVLRYLRWRKFTPQAMEYFKLGVKYDNKEKWILFPYIYQGKVKNYKMRTMPPAPKGFKRLVGGESSLFNEEVLDSNETTIILTEGESDCVSLWSQGITNVVGVTIGAKGVNPLWIDKLDKYQRIYFAYDTDPAGMRGAYQFAQRLGIERCMQIKLPQDVKDVNEFFIKGHTKEEFLKAMSAAEQFDVESVKSLGALLHDEYMKFYLKPEESGITFPWPSLGKLAGKMQPGDLWVVASKPKVGKSTFCFNLLYHFSKRGIPSLLFELEMRPERMLPRIVQMHLQKTEVSSSENINQAYQEMRDFPFYFAYGYRKLDWYTISDTIRMSIRRYGIKFVVFDNLHFLCRSKDHMTQEISIMTQNFKLLAEELAITILLIARPRKTAGGKEMEAEDLMWSADIEADADAVIILHRTEIKDESLMREGVFDDKCKVKVNRIRYEAGGVCSLRFIDAQARVEEYI